MLDLLIFTGAAFLYSIVGIIVLFWKKNPKLLRFGPITISAFFWLLLVTSAKFQGSVGDFIGGIAFFIIPILLIALSVLFLRRVEVGNKSIGVLTIVFALVLMFEGVVALKAKPSEKENKILTY
jgi:hypothetical protein